jgi:hypothetical protein
LNRLASGDKN